MRRTKADASNQYKISSQNNNYHVYKGDSNTPMKDVNSKDISHKKYGIRTRHFQAPQIYSPESIKDAKIIIKREPNTISNNSKFIYQSKTSQNQSNRNNRKNNNDGSISLFGSSQSNYVILKNNHNRNASNYLNSSKKYEQNLTMSGNNRNSDLKNLYKSSLNIIKGKGKGPNDGAIYSKATNLRNNVSSISIVDIKNKSPKPYVLNERKLDIIRYKPKSIKKYEVDVNGSVDARTIDSTKNHFIFVNKNITKEHKYNHNPNLSNVASHSIDATKKQPKKEYVLTPRKNEVIISTRPLRKSAHIIKQNENKSINFINESRSNKYNVTDLKNKYNQYNPTANLYKKNDTRNDKYNLKTDSNINRYNPKNTKNNRININDSKYTAPEQKYNKYNVTDSRNNKYNVTYSNNRRNNANDSNNRRNNVNDSKYTKNDNDTKYNKYNVNESKYNRNKNDVKDNKNIFDKTNKNDAYDYTRRANDYSKKDPVKKNDNKYKIDTNNVYKRKKNDSENSFAKGKKDEPVKESYRKPKIEDIKENVKTNKIIISSMNEPQNESKRGYYKKFQLNQNNDSNVNKWDNDNDIKKDGYKRDFNKLDDKDDKNKNREITKYKEEKPIDNNQDYTVTKVVKEKIVKINYNDDDKDKGNENGKDNLNTNQKLEKLSVKIEKEGNKPDNENEDVKNNTKVQKQKNEIENKNKKESKDENEEEEYEEEEEGDNKDANKNANPQKIEKVEIVKKVIKTDNVDDNLKNNFDENNENYKEGGNNEKLGNLKKKADEKINFEGGVEPGIYQKKVIQREEIRDDNSQGNGKELQVSNDPSKNTKKVIQEIRIVKEKYINSENDGEKGKNNLSLEKANNKSENNAISKIIKDNKLDNLEGKDDMNLITKNLNEKIPNIKPGEHIEIEEIEEHVDYGDNGNDQAENQQGKKKVVYREERHYVEGDGNDEYIHAGPERKKRETFGKEIDVDDNVGEDDKLVEKYVKYEEYNDGDKKIIKTEKLLSNKGNEIEGKNIEEN